MIDPKALDMSSIPSVYLESKSELPRESAIYFAIDSQRRIQYIGRSSDIKQRWMQHHKFSELTSIGNVRIAYLCMDVDILPSVERALIEWFQPPLNKSLSGVNSLETTKNVRIEASLHALLKILAVKKGIKLEDIANEAILEYLEFHNVAA